MQPNYFEIAKGLMIAQGQQILDRCKAAEAEQGSPLIQCENCRDYFPSDDILEFDGLHFCTEECAIEHEAKGIEIEAEEVDNSCHVCRGTGEGQNDFCACYACKGKGFIVSEEFIEP